jgi:prepilin-type N-terminal cleavage/methylation domain-containing protein
MKLNNKGMTLVELIVSIGLLSIIMAFLFKIILDVKYEKDLSGFADNNQINRTEIIKTIQTDLLTYELRNYDIMSNNLIRYTFSLGDRDLRISPDRKALTYSSIVDGRTRKWSIKDDDYKFGDIIEKHFGDYVKITIPVISNLESDATFDDIEILFKILTTKVHKL